MVCFRKNSVVCCMGDSLTQHGYWIHDVHNYLSRKHRPDNIRFYNCGIGGNTLQKASYYLVDELLWAKPDYVIISFSFNDIGGSLYLNEGEKDPEILQQREDRLNTYRENLYICAQKLTELGIQVIFSTATIAAGILEQRNTYRDIDVAYEKLRQIIRETAKKFDPNGDNIFDLYDAFMAQYRKAHAAGVELFTEDCIHLNRAGHRLWAWLVLQELGYTDFALDETYPVEVKEEEFEHLREHNLMHQGAWGYANEEQIELDCLNYRRFVLEQKLRSISYRKWGSYHPLEREQVKEDCCGKIPAWEKEVRQIWGIQASEIDGMRAELIALTEQFERG